VSVRRTALLVAPLALLAVTACEKPAPHVTVATGGRVVNIEPTRYCREAKCQQDDAAGAKIRVQIGQSLSVNVPKKVAHAGWNIRQGNELLFEAPREELHYTLDLERVRSTDIEIIQGPGSQPEGLWKLHLDLED
jgi:hypothetical protein